MRYLQHRATPILAATLLLVGLPTAHAFQESDRENVGFIYGHVTTRSGTEYTGFLRWGTEEHFWDDLFHSAKADLPYREEQRREEDRGVRIFGRDIRWGQHDHGSRIFIARFGDIEEIVVTDDERAEVRMKSGEIYDGIASIGSSSCKRRQMRTRARIDCMERWRRRSASSRASSSGTSRSA
jgi:hypothetical protein